MIRWWRGRTLRFRLAVWYSVGGTLLLAAFSATLYAFVAMRMARPLDHQLRLDLAEVRQSLAIQPDRSVLWRGQDAAQGQPWQSTSPWFEIWDGEGRLVGRFWPFAENQVQQLPIAPARNRETISLFYVAEDVRLRVLSVPLDMPGAEPDWMIRVMRIHEPAADALRALRLIIVAVLPVVVALLVLGGTFITRRWLAPLDRIGVEANRISATDIGRRLPVENPHDEVGRLAAIFNVTLDRLEASFKTLDRFVADASHELRTPLTTLRSVGEVGLRRSRTVEEYREIIGSMLEEAHRLQLLIQRLLELAAAEGGAAVRRTVRVQLDEYVKTAVGELSILAEAKSQSLIVETAPCAVDTDPVLLRQALINLVENAIKYSPAGTAVRVGVTAGPEDVVIAVQDSGPGIAAGDAARLATRFFRPDRSRDRSSGGFGLGLSITKAYMQVLGGSLHYEAPAGGGSIFRLVLPRSAA